MVRVRCPHCGYEWEYRGGRMYATCPNCLRKVLVSKAAVTGGGHDAEEEQHS